MKPILMLFIVSMFTMGCGKVFNPYKSDYMCPDVYKGKCATMDQAYEESFSENEMVINQSDCKDCDKKNKKEAATKTDAGYTYKDKLYRELSSLIDEPETPVVIPPKVARVLILNYTEENDETFYGYRHIYFIADKPRFTYKIR